MSAKKRYPGDVKYWYNTATGSVEKGAQSNFENRMGPYDTEEEARNALNEAADRNEAWDAQDKDWNG